jgi:hypothetical protein
MSHLCKRIILCLNNRTLYLKDQIRWPEGDEWESIKIPQRNSTYVLNLTQGVILLTRSRPHNYRQAISPQNRVSKPKLERKHKIVQASWIVFCTSPFEPVGQEPQWENVDCPSVGPQSECKTLQQENHAYVGNDHHNEDVGHNQGI